MANLIGAGNLTNGIPVPAVCRAHFVQDDTDLDALIEWDETSGDQLTRTVGPNARRSAVSVAAFPPVSRPEEGHMASKQHPIVTLTRAHRDAIYEHIECFVAVGTEINRSLADAEFDPEERAFLRAYAKRLTAITRLLDVLGWEKLGNHESYELEVDDQVAEFMREVEKHARGALQDNSDALADGPSKYLSADQDAENREATRHMIDLDLDALAASRRVLEVA
jgi:hypothetical protein